MKSEDAIKREIIALIQNNQIMIAETKRIWGTKKEITPYERGRAEGIILFGMDLNDNLFRFAERIGIKLKIGQFDNTQGESVEGVEWKK